MIAFLEILAFLIVAANAFFLYQILKLFFPMRGSRTVQLLAFIPCLFIADVVIFPQDVTNIVLLLAGFIVFTNIFYEGSLIKKLSAVIIFYTMVTALNYFTQDLGFQIYLLSSNESVVYSTLLHTLTMSMRIPLWLAVWRLSKHRLSNIVELLNTKMWLLLGGIGIAVFASLLIVLSFMPESPFIGYPVALASMITSFAGLYLIGYIAESIQTSFQLEALQKEYQYYEDKLKDEERIRSVYHDMKNHLLLLQSGDDGSDKSSEIIATLQEQISGYENYHKTGNAFLDVIIREKADRAASSGIDFSVMLHFEDGQFIDPMDISTIFGNALDNAIEASMKLPVSQRLVTAKANRVQDMLTIVIENHIAAETEKTLKTEKPDKLLHGLGLKNIAHAVEKYDGQYAVKQNEDRFTLTIIIPIP